MYDLKSCITNLDIRSQAKWAVSHVMCMATLTFLKGLYGYAWVNMLTLSNLEGCGLLEHDFLERSLESHLNCYLTDLTFCTHQYTAPSYTATVLVSMYSPPVHQRSHHSHHGHCTHSSKTLMEPRGLHLKM